MKPKPFPAVMITGLGLGLGLGLLSTGALRAEPARPAPPQSRPEHFDPDPLTCRQDTIRRQFQAQLLPWQDQPPAVLAQLRSLQAEMTRASLRRCVQRGLMTKQEAVQLAGELQLIAPTRP